MKRRPIGGTLLLLAALAGAGACAAPGEPGRHVLLILLDAARPDRFGSYDPGRATTPHLDLLAARGAVFLDHFSQATDTRSALPRLLYSRYFVPPLFPLSSKVPYSDPSDLFRQPDPEAVSLPAALAAHGFHTAMISAHTWLRPETPFAREFGEAIDLSSELALERGYPHPRAGAVIDFAIDWLERHRERDVFLYLHLMDTHSPRFFDDDAAALFAGGPEAARRWRGTRDHELAAGDGLDDGERRALDAIYDGSVRYADRHLGRLFDLYRGWGVLDRTLIALTSDHGELLAERRGALGHGGPWYEPVARVPLIVSLPARLEARRVERPSESIDLVPTILGLLDLEPPPGRSFDGVDLLAERARPARAAAFGNQALRVDGFKVIFDAPDELLLGRDDPDPASLAGELYDLTRDPGEQTDLWSERPEIVAAALTAYRERLARPYARYRRTRSERQPESSFAIAARHFRTALPVPTTAGRRSAAAGGWVLSDHWQDSYLLALPGAPPLTIELALPDGTYELSAAISGGCTLDVAGSEPRRLETPASGEAARAGEIEVRDRTFTATLTPDPERSPFSISYLGFRPAGAERDDATRDQRLRALGYID